MPGHRGMARLHVGDTAPDFEAEASDGRRIRLSDLRGRAVVLYFFPKAFTPICTEQTRRFRDNHAELRSLGAEVLGASADDLETQCRFGEAQAASFPLLSDADGQIARRYGVMWPLLGRARRVTYVIGETGVVEAIFHHEFQVSKHLDGVLDHLRKRKPMPVSS